LREIRGDRERYDRNRRALKPDKPDVAEVTAMVNEVMHLYNEALAEVVKAARARQ
jgi:hypothetical protein